MVGPGGLRLGDGVDYAWRPGRGLVGLSESGRADR